MSVTYYSPVYTVSPALLKITKTYVPSYYYYPTTITLPRYDNLNYDTTVIDRITNYFYYKTIEKWLYDELSSLLKFLKIGDNDRVSVVDSVDNYKNAKSDIGREKDIKISFVKKYMITKHKIQRLLFKYMKRNDIPLIKMYRYRHEFRRYIRRKLEDEFIDIIRERKRI